jgi:hypothetical protein
VIFVVRLGKVAGLTDGEAVATFIIQDHPGKRWQVMKPGGEGAYSGTGQIRVQA